MHIASRFHDYYDTAQSNGYDNHVYYARESKQLTITSDHFKEMIENLPKYNIRTIQSDLLVRSRPVIVGFCGKLHILYEIQCLDTNTVKYCKDSDEMLRVFADKKYQPTYQSFTSGKKHYWYRVPFTKKYVDRALQKFNGLEHVDLFVEHHVPVFSIRESENLVLLLNPNLSKYKFYRLFDAYSAHQEIEMFLGGVLCNTEKIIKIEDRYLMRQKGFDEWSFKKEPERIRT